MDKPSLTIHVHFNSVLADYASTRQVDIKVPEGTTLEKFLKILAGQFTTTFKQVEGDLGKRHSFVRIFRNGELVSGENDQDLLKEGDDIRLFPAISGG